MGPITGAMLDLTSSPTSGDNASTTQVAYTTEEIESSLIYVGDQRMINLQSSLNNSNISFITSSDGNYSWLYGTAEGAINSSVTDKEKFVVLALGLNDLNDIDNYINEYNALITKNSKANFYVLSVNPVDDSKATTITNSSIETFNSKLKSTFGEKYIDTYSVLESSYVTLDDGISYDDNTNKTIHNTVVEYIKSKNMKSVGSTTFLDSYSTEGAGGNILMESLVSKIGQDGLNKLNSDIAANVNSSGKCTGNAVAAAAVTLINELLQKKIIIPYVYGGGHDVVSIGADGSWGTLVMGGTTNIYKGLDCSSFVSWAMTNAGIPMNGGTSDLMKAFPNSISFANAKPGDILIKNGHVMLVIENKGTYFVTAEARTPQYGVVFSQYKYTDKYISDFTVRDTSSYYQSHCNK
jgi:cell wall-associated NlpC family hydrolase